jgi:hypothetical protein
LIYGEAAVFKGWKRAHTLFILAHATLDIVMVMTDENGLLSISGKTDLTRHARSQLLSSGEVIRFSWADLLVAKLSRAKLTSRSRTQRMRKTFLKQHWEVSTRKGARFNTTGNKTLSTGTQICDYFVSCLYMQGALHAENQRNRNASRAELKFLFHCRLASGKHV